MWKRLVVQNFKSLKDISLELGPCTVLVGSNASGKTSILQACELVGELVTPQAGGVPALQRLQQRFADPARFDVGLYRTRGVMSEDISISVTICASSNGDAEELVGIRINGATAETKPSQTVSLLFKELRIGISPPERDSRVSVGAAEDLAALAEGPALAVALNASALAAPSIPSTEGALMLRNGRGLPSVLADMAATDRGRIQQVEDALQKIVPRARGIRTPLTRVSRVEQQEVSIGGSSQLHSIAREHSGHRLEINVEGAGWLDASLLSEGTLIALGVLTLVHSASCPRLLLVDDLDHSLHPSAYAALVSALREVVARGALQLVCTTHAPYLLDNFAADEVRVVSSDAQGHTRVSALSDHAEWPGHKGALSTGEFWSSVGESWVSESGKDVA